MSAKSLTAEQQKIVEHRAASIIVAAGPGSGKTHVIVARIKSYLDQGYLLSNIILLTFTKQAALNMIERLQVQSTHKDLIGTFHSVALKIIIQNAKWYPHYAAELKVVSDYEKSTILLNLLRDHSAFARNAWLQQDTAKRLKVKTAALHYINNCTRHIGENYEAYVRKYPQVTSIRGFIRKLGYEGLSVLVKTLLQHYFDYLDAQGLQEFDDLLHVANKLLGDPRVRKRYRGYIHQILVDELQDIDKIQHVFLLRLRTLQAGFFMVGDDDQAIYGFRGATNCFKELAATFQAQLLTLSENHRSNKDIVQVSRDIITLNVQRVNKELISYKDPSNIAVLPQVPTFKQPLSPQAVLHQLFGLESPPLQPQPLTATPALVHSHSVLSYLYASPHAVALGVALTCKELLAKNLQTSIAILFRWNNQSALLERGMLAGGLAYAKAGVTGSRTMHYLLNFLQLVLTREDDPFKQVSKELLFTAEEYDHLLATPVAASLYDRAQQLYPHQTEKLVELVDSLSLLATSHKLSTAQLHKILTDILTFAAQKLPEGLTAAEKRTLAHLGKSPQDIWQGLPELAAELHASHYQHTVVQDLKGLLLYLSSARTICLSTIHASKGREYDYVFVVGNESLIAFQDSEEERRVLYVALTRARHGVYIAHSDATLQELLKNILRRNRWRC